MTSADQWLGDVLGAVPDPFRQAGQEAGAEGGGLRHRRPHHVHAELVGLQRQQQVHDRCPAVHPELLGRVAGGGRHGLDDVACLIRHGLDHRPGQVAGPDAPGQADDGSAGVGVPPRAAQPGEGGDQVDAVGVGNGLGQGADLGGLSDDAELVSQPLDGGTGHEDGALQGVGHRGGLLQLPRHGGDQSLGGFRALGPDVHQHEAPGAVGVLDHARLEAGLAEQRRLLVTGRPADRHPGREPLDHLRRRGAQPSARRADLGKHRGRDPEQVGQLVVPRPRPDVQQRGPGGVGHVRGVDLATRQAPQHPAVHRPERHVGARLETALAEQPTQLGGGEVRVEDQAGPAAHQVQVPGLRQLPAHPGGPAVLPDDGPVQGPAGAAVPDHDRLPLIGDPDGGHRLVQVRQDPASRLRHRLPDLLGVVLNPAGSGKILGKLAVPGPDGVPGGVDRHGPYPGGPGVDGEDDGHGPTLIANGKIPTTVGGDLCAKEKGALARPPHRRGGDRKVGAKANRRGGSFGGASHFTRPDQIQTNFPHEILPCGQPGSTAAPIHRLGPLPVHRGPVLALPRPDHRSHRHRANLREQSETH